jgi:hypothetical protein
VDLVSSFLAEVKPTLETNRQETVKLSDQGLATAARQGQKCRFQRDL